MTVVCFDDVSRIGHSRTDAARQRVAAGAAQDGIRSQFPDDDVIAAVARQRVVPLAAASCA